MKFTSLLVSTLLSLVAASPLEQRSTTTVTAKFDDIPNSFPIPSPYVNLAWPNFIVSSPDRSQPSYVKAPSPFQYARVLSGNTGTVKTAPGTTSFLINSFRYGCSAPHADTNNPGPPKACTIAVTEKCATASQSRSLSLKYTPDAAIADMSSANLAAGRKCTKGVSYTFKTSGADVLLDGVVIAETS